MNDSYNLQRFVDAQASVYEVVRSELKAGRKQSHWIWFIFPQLKGLGFSSTAQFYGIGSRGEAEAYLAHPVLGARLRECTALVNAVNGRSIDQILGYPDDMKFRSSVTLFSAVTEENQVFEEALRKYFGGVPDPATVSGL